MCAVCAVHRWTVLLVAEGTRRATRRLLLAHQLDEHMYGRDGGPSLLSNADLALSSPLLRATYRNRRSAAIHGCGITGEALHRCCSPAAPRSAWTCTSTISTPCEPGTCNQARRNGASTEEIMRADRWKKAETVEAYDRELKPAARNSAMRLGL